jgi:hypothetical protein
VSIQDDLFQVEEFGISAPASATIIFICPYGTPIEKVRFAIRRLLRAGYRVVAYQTTTAVFTAADPLILPELISQVRADIRARISRLAAEGVAEFGFFGSSLGSFILYNCVGRNVPELRWGVFNTGGNIAQGMWKMLDLRQLHAAQGWSLSRLEDVWAELQWPDFGRLDGCRFVFVSSYRDDVAPLADIAPYLGPMLAAGADVSVRRVPAISHRTTVIAGLWNAPRLIRLVRQALDQTLVRDDRGGDAKLASLKRREWVARRAGSGRRSKPQRRGSRWRPRRPRCSCGSPRPPGRPDSPRPGR